MTEARFKPLEYRLLGKFAPDEHDRARRPLVLAPGPSRLGGDHHMYALQDLSPWGAAHKKHAFIPKQVLPVNLGQRTQVLLEPGWDERAARAKNESLHGVVVR